MKSISKAELFLLGITLIWGSTFVITKNALATASPLAFMSIRFGLASLIFWAIYRKEIDFKISKISLAGFGVSLSMLIGFATQTAGLKYTSASHSGFITGLLVIFTPIFQIMIEKKWPKWGTILGVILVTIGLFLLINPQNILDQNTLFGDFLTLICAISFAIYIVLIDVASKKDNIYFLTFLQMLVVAIGGIFCSFFIEKVYVEFNTNLLISALYLAIMATIVATFVQTKYQKETTPAKAAVIFTMEPVFSAVLAFFVLGEMIGWTGMLGGMIIVSGLLLSELSKS